MPMDKAFEVYRALSRDGAVTYGVFSSFMQKNDLGLDSEAINELFEGADGNKNGIISPNGWSALCANYPTLMDCVYHKERDRQFEEGFRTSEEQAGLQCERAIGLEESLRKNCIETGRDAEIASETLYQQEEIVIASMSLDEECKSALQHAKQASDLGRENLKSAMQKLGRAKNTTTTTRVAIQKEEKQIQATEIGMQTKLKEVQSAVSRLKAIEKLLADQRLIVEVAMTESEGMQSIITKSSDQIHILQREVASQEADEEDLKIEVVAMESKSAELSRMLSMAERNLRESESNSTSETKKKSEQQIRLKTLMAIDSEKQKQLDSASNAVLLAQQRRNQISEEEEAYIRRRYDEHREELQLLQQEV